MSTQDIHDLYAVTVAGSLLGGITQQGIPTGTTVRGEANSGSVYPNIMSLVGQSPGASLTTQALASWLGAVGLTGTAISSGATAVLYAQKHAAGGTRAGALSHRSFTVSEGIIVPRTLSCDHQGDAVLTYDIVATYDGTNNPVVIADGITLPTGAAGNGERFTIGPATISGTTFDSIKRFELDFGISLNTEGGDSDVWPTHVSIASINPVLTLSGIDLTWLQQSGDIPLMGAAAAHADTTVYLRKRDDGGTFVADATAEHVSITAHGLAYVTDGMTSTSNQTGESALMLNMNFDGTNPPAIIDVAAALP